LLKNIAGKLIRILEVLEWSDQISACIDREGDVVRELPIPDAAQMRIANLVHVAPRIKAALRRGDRAQAQTYVNLARTLSQRELIRHLRLTVEPGDGRSRRSRLATATPVQAMWKTLRGLKGCIVEGVRLEGNMLTLRLSGPGRGKRVIDLQLYSPAGPIAVAVEHVQPLAIGAGAQPTHETMRRLANVMEHL
jgi:hypothetical protein